MAAGLKRQSGWITAGSFVRALKTTTENQPYTAVAIALGASWLLGGMHRPL